MPDQPTSSVPQFVRNLRRGDLSLARRIALLLRNYPRRLVRRDLCCGHPGEPGC